MSSHAVIKVKNTRAVIGKHTFNDVVQFASNWGLNSIPMASLQVAVGRNVNGNALAKIHHAAKDLRNQQKAEVYVTFEVTDIEDADPGVESGEIKVFEGTVVGTGWQRGPNGGYFTINLLYWLGELNNSSAISASLHPGCPADMTFPAVFPAFGLNTTTPKVTPIPSFVPDISGDVAGGFDDLWGNVFLPWLNTIASDDAFDRAYDDANAKGNPDVIAALKRMGTNADGTPLAVDLNGASAAVFADSLRLALVNEIGGNWINTTLWGKIIGEWAPAYWFSVVPRVEDALIVPFTGGLQGSPWAVIGDEDYDSADMNAQLLQVLRGVSIVHPITTSTSFDLNLGIPQASRSGALDIYQPDDIKTGMILFKDAPKWLCNTNVAHLMSADAEGVMDATVTTALDEINSAAAAQRKDDANDLGLLRNVASAYAHQWYVLESLKGRTGEVAGKLRFDIAPGSNVLVVAGGAKNVPDSKNVTQNIFATVVQVSYVINAETRQAGTAFSLAHIRTEAENELESTSVAKPPLYQKAWSGAKLVVAAPGPEKA